MKDTNEDFISVEDTSSDVQIENFLRPKLLSEYIGQERVKDSLSVYIQAAKLRGQPIDHVLLYGPPGLGKTTLAMIVSNEVNSKIHITSGPAIERSGDLVSILTSLEDSDILFIDEIHRLSKVVEEVLYPAMEDFAVDLVIGKGPSAKTLRVDLPHFTLIGATTRASLISSPMRDRFGIVHSLDYYQEDEIAKILKRSAQILELGHDQISIEEIAKRSRKTPRIANRLLKRVGDFALVYNKGKMGKELVLNAMERIGIDEHGLDEVDRKVLSVIIDKFMGGPVGVDTIAAASGIEKNTIEEVIEPFLMQCGFLKRSPRGRMATDKAFEYLGKIKKIQ